MFLNKPMLIIILVLGVLLSGTAYYTKKLLQENAVITEEIKLKDTKISEMNTSLIKQELRFKDTLKVLEVRESKIKLIENHNNNLKKKVQEISNDKSDECINALHSNSISDILHNKD
jgi:hypothetical protein